VEYKIEKSTAYQISEDSVELKILGDKQWLSGPIVAIRTKEGLISTVDVCQVDMMLHLMDYAAHENCGYCSLGRVGTEVIYRFLKDIFAGTNQQKPVGADKLALLETLGHDIINGALCNFCQLSAQMVLESLNNHRDHYEAHLHGEHDCQSYDYHVIHFTNCQIACPLKTDVAFFFQALVTENTREAKSYLNLTNIFPEILSGVCGYCKGNCTFKKTQGKPLPIEQIKGYLCQTAMPEIPGRPETSVLDRVSFKITNSLHKGRYQKTHKRIGIIGAGPAGLSAAIYLAQMGYRSTVLDFEPTWGGTMRTGIPAYRLDNHTLDRIIRTKLASPIAGCTSEDQGPGITYGDLISFSFNTKISARNFHELLDEFDRLIVASGTLKNRCMGIPGEDPGHAGMVDPLEVMRQVNTEGGLKAIKPGSKVIVIGGGNVAIDCAREAKRIGCDSWIYYRRTPKEMPADEEEYEEALHEGVRFAFKMWPKEIKNRKGKITHMLFTDKSDPDNPKEVEVEVDYIITAVGQIPDLDFFPKDINLETERGNLVIDDFLKTSNQKIYVAGDLSWKQPKLVCKAIHEGIEAAIAIDREFRPKRYTDPNETIIRQLVEIARLLYQDKDPYQEIYGEDITRCGVAPPSQRIKTDTLRKTVKDIVTSCLKCKQFVIGVVDPATTKIP
jgi:NADPH-dependent glutamate synthase beta subunit-like oxidoreductase